MPLDLLKHTAIRKTGGSIAEQIYQSLKAHIIDGNLEPGCRLYETEVADHFGASRTPVREALRRLEQDFLVERVAQGGMRVVSMDNESIRDLFNLRAVLECYAIELACERITAEQIATLKQIRAQAMALLDNQEVGRDYLLKNILALNSQFHETIYEATGSRYILRMISHLRGIVLGMRTLSIQADQALPQAWEEHSRLIELLEKGDRKTSAQLIKVHIEHAAKQTLSVVGDK
jgi:DNA-binding GntR family transcriptional regulator